MVSGPEAPALTRPSEENHPWLGAGVPLQATGSLRQASEFHVGEPASLSLFHCRILFSRHLFLLHAHGCLMGNKCLATLFTVKGKKREANIEG